MYVDQLNMFLPMDNEMADALESLAPHKSSFSLNGPKLLSRSMSIPKPVVSNIASWIDDGENEVADVNKQAIMQSLLT